MSSTSNITKWNIVDSVIFSAEQFILKLVTGIKDSKDDLPDPEEMIQAATKELQAENDELKQYRLPGHLIELGDSYACPVCKRKVSDVESIKNNEIKYCNGCGKRIILPQTSPYIKYANNWVKGEDNNRPTK